MLPKLTQSRLPDPNTLEITFTLTNEEINTWQTGIPYEFQGNNEDIYIDQLREEGIQKVDLDLYKQILQVDIHNLKFKMNGEFKI